METIIRNYEEFVRVLDFRTRQRSSTIHGRKGIILITIGESKFTLLEVIGNEGATFEVGERIDVSREKRSKIESVLGKLTYSRIPSNAKEEIPKAVADIVENSEERFVSYINRAQPLTPRTHGLEIIPGIGKQMLKTITKERDKGLFESYEDIQERTGFNNPASKIIERIMDEVTGITRMNIFVKR